MNTENWINLASRARTELVFEGRNKEYGAYFLRQKQSLYMVQAMGWVLGTLAVLAGLCIINNPVEVKANSSKINRVQQVIVDLVEPLKLPENANNTNEKSSGSAAVQKVGQGLPSIGNDQSWDPAQAVMSYVGGAGVGSFSDLFDSAKLDRKSNGNNTDFINSAKKMLIINTSSRYKYGDFEAYLINGLRKSYDCLDYGIISMTAEFAVNANGKVEQLIIKDCNANCPEFEQELRGLIVNSEWIAGTKNGKAIATKRKLPIILKFE